MEISASALIEELKLQRNQALDNIAMLEAVVKLLQSQLDELKKKPTNATSVGGED